MRGLFAKGDEDYWSFAFCLDPTIDDRRHIHHALVGSVWVFSVWATIANGGDGPLAVSQIEDDDLAPARKSSVSDDRIPLVVHVPM